MKINKGLKPRVELMRNIFGYDKPKRRRVVESIYRSVYYQIYRSDEGTMIRRRDSR